MRAVSSRFLDTIRYPHKVVVRARLVETYQTGTDPVGVEIPIIDGDIRYDATADVRATLDMTTDGTGWSTSPKTPLTPYGNEIYVERGVEYADGTREWVGQGYYRIYSVEQDSAPDGPLRIAGRDRMSGIIDARLTAPVSFGPNHTIRQVFERLVREVYPEAEIIYGFDPDGIALGRAQVAEEDRYGFLLEVTRSLGMVMYWDHTGALRVERAPDPANPVWTVNAGSGGVLVSMSRALDRDGAYNAMVVTGEAPDGNNPVRAVAYNLNPASPTYWHGRFGKVPRFYSSPFITTAAQARTVATEMLRRVLGTPYSVDFTAVPNPALEPLDPVRVVYSDDHPAEVHVIEQMTLPLTPGGALTATTREKSQAYLNLEDTA